MIFLHLWGLENCTNINKNNGILHNGFEVDCSGVRVCLFEPGETLSAEDALTGGFNPVDFFPAADALFRDGFEGGGGVISGGVIGGGPLVAEDFCLVATFFGEYDGDYMKGMK